jgi:YhcH/YjgK/YiaL family protein
MALFGSIETVRAQSPNTPAFATAWTYIDELLRPDSAAHQRLAGLAAGGSNKVELANGVFAIEQAYETKARSDGFFEAHKKYIDVQFVVSGKETMEVVDISRAKVREEYQEARDLIVFQDVKGASALKFVDGEAAVFFPADVHMPSLRSGRTATLIRKIVLKIPVGA